MKKETLFDAIGGVDEALIEDAAKPRRKKTLRWLVLAPVAACLAVFIGFASIALRPAGSSAPAGGADPGGNTSGSSVPAVGDDPGENSSGFHSYVGPILPLTALTGGEGLIAEREVTLDLSSGLYTAAVTDRYVLTNPTGEDVSAELLYPVISSLYELYELAPAVTVDGAAPETELLVGDYTGGFRGAGGSGEGLALNFDPLRSWEGYAQLLSDGSYLAAVLEGHADLSGIPVTVYQFTNAWGPEESDKIPNPTIRAYFELDYDKTTVLSYGFHGGSYDREEGVMGRSFSIRKPTEPDYGEPFYLIVVGEDIENLTTGGYVTGGWDTKKTIEYGVDITRYETNLDTVLQEIFDLMYEPTQSWPVGSSREQWYALFCDYLVNYGELARYSEGMLEGVDFDVVDRVCWLRFTVTVPAGGSVEVTASLTRESSHNYPGAGQETLYGYEIATQLGSVLNFTSQTLTLAGAEDVSVPAQNLALDPAGGVTSTPLDPGQELYFLHVTRS